MSLPDAREQRASIRFNHVFPVFLSGEDFGEIEAVARNISSGGMLIETPSLPPLGSEVCVRFRVPDSDASLFQKLHKWITPPIDTKDLALSGDASMSLRTQTIEHGVYGATICLPLPDIERFYNPNIDIQAIISGVRGQFTVP